MSLNKNILFAIPLLLLASCSTVKPSCEREIAFVPESHRVAIQKWPREKCPLIVIDAGHGGKDLGANSKKNPHYQEKVLALSTAKLIRQYLHQLGYRTAMTREEDVFIPLRRRAAIANEKRAHLFLSIHYNAAPSTKAEGVEVLYFKTDETPKRSEASKALGEAVLGRVIANTEAKKRSVKHQNLAVTRETKMPAILVEGGFLTHVEERKRILHEPFYKQRLAWGIAEGVDHFVQEKLIVKKKRALR